MIEFHARLLVDTQDPARAFDELNSALRFSGVRAEVTDCWLKNNAPLPAHTAQKIAWEWMKARKGLRFGNDVVKFHTKDPCFQTKLDNLRKVVATAGKGDGR